MLAAAITLSPYVPYNQINLLHLSSVMLGIVEASSCQVIRGIDLTYAQSASLGYEAQFSSVPRNSGLRSRGDWGGLSVTTARQTIMNPLTSKYSVHQIVVVP